MICLCCRPNVKLINSNLSPNIMGSNNFISDMNNLRSFNRNPVCEVSLTTYDFINYCLFFC